MEKFLFTLILIPTFIHARPMEIMNQRLKTYKDSASLECGDPLFRKSSHALKMGIACSYKCLNSSPELRLVKEVFSPKGLGLAPGNGSGSDKIIWSSLTIGLKTWSEKQCLDMAIQNCKELSSVENVSVKEVSSGSWKIKSFPKCNEKKVVISPFDDNSGAEQFYALPGELIKGLEQTEGEKLPKFSFKAKGFEMTLPLNDDENQKCEKKIIGNICYGDCIDMNSTGNALTETLATPEPLGKDTISICADELYARLKREKLSPSSKQMICENYFWTTIMKGRITVKACAAVRGEVDCSSL